MPRKFEDGIAFYTEAVVNKSVFFPEKEVRCQYCEFCRAEKDLERFWCRLTNDMIYNPYSAVLPTSCPLVFAEDIKKERD